MQLPLQNIQDWIFKDFLPPPIAYVSNFTNGSSIAGPTATPPPAWTVVYGPSGPNLNPPFIINYPGVLGATGVTGPNNPILLSLDLSGNAISLDIGTIQDLAPNIPQTLDLLYTVMISEQPFQNGIVFTNQANSSYSNTTGSNYNIIGTTSLTLDEPDVYINKSIVAATLSDGTTNTGSYTSLANFYGPVNSPNVGPGFTGPLGVSYFNNFTAGGISNITDNSILRYVILVCNEGSANAYNVTLEDDTNYLLNLNVIYGFDLNGNSTAITYSGPTGPTGAIYISFTNPIPPLSTYFLIAEFSLNNPDPCTNTANTVLLDAFYNQPGLTGATGNFVDSFSLVRSAISDINMLQPSLKYITNSISPTINPITTGNGWITLGQTANMTLLLTLPAGTYNNASIVTSINKALLLTNNGNTYNNITINGEVGTIGPTGFSWTYTSLIVPPAGGTGVTGSIAFNFKALFPSYDTGLVNNVSVKFTGNYSDDSSCNIKANKNFTIKEPNVVISKSIDQLSNNDVVYYDVTITNNSQIAASSYTFTDALPYGLTGGWSGPTGVTGPDLSNFDFSSSTSTNIIGTISNLPAGNSDTFRFSAPIDYTVPVGTTFTNTVLESYWSIPLGTTGGSTGPSGTIRGYTGSSSVSYMRNPELCVVVTDTTENPNNDYNLYSPNRNITVGTIGDVMTYSGQFYLLQGLTNLSELVIDISPSYPLGSLALNALSTTVNLISSDQSIPNMIVPVIYDPSVGTVTFLINTPVYNPNSYAVSYSFQFGMRIDNNINNQAGVLYNAGSGTGGTDVLVE